MRICHTPGESVGEHVLTEPIERLPTGPAEASAPFGVTGTHLQCFLTPAEFDK